MMEKLETFQCFCLFLKKHIFSFLFNTFLAFLKVFPISALHNFHVFRVFLRLYTFFISLYPSWGLFNLFSFIFKFWTCCVFSALHCYDREYISETFLRLLYSTKTFVQYWDFCTVLRLLLSTETFVQFSLKVQFEGSVWEYTHCTESTRFMAVGLVFSRVHATLQFTVSICLSVCRSVCLLSLRFLSIFLYF